MNKCTREFGKGGKELRKLTKRGEREGGREGGHTQQDVTYRACVAKP